VIYCQPSPSKHCTPKLAVFFWQWAKCHPVVAMLTAKKIYKPLACRLPRSNAQTRWTLNWQLVTPRSDLGVDPHISGPSVLSLRKRADMDYVGVARDGCCSGQNVSHETEDIEFLNQYLLCIGKDEASCETGLKLRRSKCNHI